MKRYHIRFNTKAAGSPLVWRVFENGEQHLVKHLDIRVPVRDENTMEGTEMKWNIACDGHMRIVDDVAIITAE